MAGLPVAARRLCADPLSLRAPDRISPPVLRAALQAWQAAGVPPSTAALHTRTLRAALGWAFDERLIASQPLQGMRGPGQPEPRRDVPLHVVRALLNAAQAEVEQAKVEQARGPGRSAHRRHQAEQVLLLLRLAADSGARPGELGCTTSTSPTGSSNSLATELNPEGFIAGLMAALGPGVSAPF